ncbi:MAG TPA: hypothetical protein V6D47_08010 [Oscillatoriaceae cyanobacterium]
MANSLGITNLRGWILQIGKIFCGAAGGLFIGDGIHNFLALKFHHLGTAGATDRIVIGIALLVLASAVGASQKVVTHLQASAPSGAA